MAPSLSVPVTAPLYMPSSQAGVRCRGGPESTPSQLSWTLIRRLL